MNDDGQVVKINPSTLTCKIREEALRLGFFKIGFARAGQLLYKEHFESWLRSGFHGEMRFLERQAPKRMDPGLALNGVRSVIVLALNYSFARNFKEAPLRGRISRYAWGNDYHPVVRNRLNQLLEFIRRQDPEIDGLICVDSGPVMEKVWGAQTSIGWMGKNTALIIKNHGSRFFIGTLLLTTELEPDTQAEDFCGTCDRCIGACPTGAIIAPYTLDARRCVSYLTVEYRGVIARELRPLIGNRIYGCDDCQDACPWNRKPVPSRISDLEPKDENGMPPLPVLATISHEEFDRRFAHSPIRRITRDVLVRNVVIALGNACENESVPVLEKALADSSPLVRVHAAWSLGQMLIEGGRSILEAARTRESDTDVLAEITTILEGK
jgi:epoxyqueuosine reductase